MLRRIDLTSVDLDTVIAVSAFVAGGKLDEKYLDGDKVNPNCACNLCVPARFKLLIYPGSFKEAKAKLRWATGIEHCKLDSGDGFSESISFDVLNFCAATFKC